VGPADILPAIGRTRPVASLPNFKSAGGTPTGPRDKMSVPQTGPACRDRVLGLYLSALLAKKLGVRAAANVFGVGHGRPGMFNCSSIRACSSAVRAGTHNCLTNICARFRDFAQSIFQRWLWRGLIPVACRSIAQFCSKKSTDRRT
jgi:hypothetical protein